MLIDQNAHQRMKNPDQCDCHHAKVIKEGQNSGVRIYDVHIIRGTHNDMGL